MNAFRIAAQLNAARLPGERCEYKVTPDLNAVFLSVDFNNSPHTEPIWCELGLRYAEDGGLDPAIVARTHSNTKFRLTQRLQKKYLKLTPKTPTRSTP